MPTKEELRLRVVGLMTELAETEAKMRRQDTEIRRMGDVISGLRQQNTALNDRLGELTRASAGEDFRLQPAYRAWGVDEPNPVEPPPITGYAI